MFTKHQFVRFAALYAALCVLGGCATNPVTGRQDFVLMSESQEIALGRQASQQVMQQYRPYPDQELQNYVNTVGQKLAAVSHRADINYEFTLLDSTEINAFALPGGYIYITRGLLAYMSSEAELAAVLGHEIGHVTARHSVRQATSHQAAGLGVGLLGVLFPSVNNPAIGQAVNVLGTALLRGYGRDHELEADRLGAEYLARSGYDPQAMFRVVRALKNQELFDQKLARLEGREPRRYHGVFATHPDNDTRLKEVVDYVAAQQTTVDVVERDRFLDNIDGLLFGPNPDDGIMIGDEFVHPPLGIGVTYPAGWRIQNLPDRVAALSADGKAQLQMTLRKVPPGASPAAVVRELGLPDLQQARTLELGQLSGITGLTTVSSNVGQLPARISVIRQEDNAFILTGITRSAAAFRTYDGIFAQHAHSFRQLAQAEREQIKAQRIRVVRLDGAISWDTLARISPLDKLPADHLRLLNAAEPDEPAPNTRKIKVIE